MHRRTPYPTISPVRSSNAHPPGTFDKLLLMKRAIAPLIAKGQRFNRDEFNSILFLHLYGVYRRFFNGNMIIRVMLIDMIRMSSEYRNTPMYGIIRSLVATMTSELGIPAGGIKVVTNVSIMDPESLVNIYTTSLMVLLNTAPLRVVRTFTRIPESTYTTDIASHANAIIEKRRQRSTRVSNLIRNHTVQKKEVCPDGMCVVCMDKLKKEKVGCMKCPGCKNYIHNKCIKTWLLAHTTCPMCKYEFDGL